ncbi:hypothetical protein CPAR01_15898 [Colletotrichum paranaense]|uniref:Uncharacterized protein n=1 Tax=Colletotrichum paranaense TaxID=1914294 RepID=A0ABQ9RXQ2_9PEZI|nr:uncharacterized protein CPAR01_15898 [Colletotrichum paranaense]KAK1517418.1 hypothetical protein CPAR01_15898 [Colletotrichum paranaense]
MTVLRYWMALALDMVFLLRTGDAQLEPVFLGLILAQTNMIVHLHVFLTRQGVDVERDVVLEQGKAEKLY